MLVELFTPDHGRIGALSLSVRGPKRQWVRAVLQPFTPLRIDFQQRGELANLGAVEPTAAPLPLAGESRSEEHTSELQSLMRISYAVFCLKKKKPKQYLHNFHTTPHHYTRSVHETTQP